MHLSSKKIIYLIAVIILITSGFIGFIFRHKFQGQTYTVTLKPQGFIPQTLTIHQWDKVIFTSEQGKEFWPASDPHPIHDLYSAFDPLEPIDPNGSWSFQFDRKGSWHYHNHLDPFFRGTINVE